jgi:hypothetical protein
MNAPQQLRGMHAFRILVLPSRQKDAREESKIAKEIRVRGCVVARMRDVCAAGKA